MNFNVEHAPFFYFCTDDDGKILDINSRLCQKLGFEKSFLTGKNQEIIFTISTRIFQQTHLLPLLQIESTANEILINLQTKIKEKFSVLFNIERLSSGNKFIVHYAGIEIVQRRKYEERLLSDKKLAESALLENTALNHVTTQLHQKLEELESQLNIANKQAAELKQFNKVITHDLEEPLRKLFLFADLLSSAHEPARIRTITSGMLEAATKTKKLVAGLQQYIWLSEAAVNPVEQSLDDIIGEISNKLKDEWPGISYNIEKENTPVLFGDKDQLALLMFHLLSNILRFRKPGEQATGKLSAKLLQLNKFRSIGGKYKYEDHIRVELKDNGIGFDAENKARVFDLFQTLHDNSGTGIGLSLCRMVIENHGGEIHIDSAKNLGTTITFTLPVNKL